MQLSQEGLLKIRKGDIKLGKDYRYNIKLNPNNAEHMRVAQILDNLGRGEMRQLIVNAVLAYTMKSTDGQIDAAYDMDTMRTTIYAMVEESLKKHEAQNKNESVKTERHEPKTSVQPTYLKPDTNITDADEKGNKPGTIDDIMKSLNGFI